MTETDPAPVKRKLAAEELQAARAAARERYALIAEALKREAGIESHFTHKQISGLAWSDRRQILAPEGVTRRQLYVLAHECGHIVLHSTPEAWSLPGHVKEHEAETYAHRAFRRYGLEIPKPSAQWARGYVAQWIRKDQAAGIAICSLALAFANGQRSPFDPLPSVDGHPMYDLSKEIDKLVAKGNRIAQEQTPETRPMMIRGEGPPNACGTCIYYREDTTWASHSQCRAFMFHATEARVSRAHCNNGDAWRPSQAELRKFTGGFWSRFGNALIDRLSGRYRLRYIEPETMESNQGQTRGDVVKLEDHSKAKK